MSQTIKAVFENGVFRPLDPVSLEEDQQVTLQLITTHPADSQVSPVSCYDLARKLGILGTVDDAPDDLSSNPQYFDGFGET